MILQLTRPHAANCRSTPDHLWSPISSSPPELETHPASRPSLPADHNLRRPGRPHTPPPAKYREASFPRNSGCQSRVCVSGQSAPSFRPGGLGRLLYCIASGSSAIVVIITQAPTSHPAERKQHCKSEHRDRLISQEHSGLCPFPPEIDPLSSVPLPNNAPDTLQISTSTHIQGSTQPVESSTSKFLFPPISIDNGWTAQKGCGSRGGPYSNPSSPSNLPLPPVLPCFLLEGP
ncbi:hypothetical protein CALVIDRAFT_534847 [Calocera viscosa TUFC12733]|uniref:Uncharacterized protein n=1 Tax=Calocera viscosa (strain TUFC12733) TaxID=1330018 RepID=A0A167PGN3_CALVF|nr:hypothetical protein CALVIDRAFT_534847 [Calocera viscosa TUFC12733]